MLIFIFENKIILTLQCRLDIEDNDDKSKVDYDEEEGSWTGGSSYRSNARDRKSGPIPTFRAYSSEEFNNRERMCIGHCTGCSKKLI